MQDSNLLTPLVSLTLSRSKFHEIPYMDLEVMDRTRNLKAHMDGDHPLSPYHYLKWYNIKVLLTNSDVTNICLVFITTF